MRLPENLSALAPESAQFCLRAEKTLEKLAGNLEGRHFLLSLSGGSDSTCLAVVLGLLAKRRKFFLSALHFDHQCRTDSGMDADFVANLCGALKIKLGLVRFDMAKFARSRKCGLEEAGHMARRGYCLDYASKNSLNGILLAHHADDLIEDMLLRLVRGTGWPGLGGMRQKNGIFLRPFLFLPKSALTAFLEREGIPWREDTSNGSQEFRRNRIRHFITPFLKKENPGLARSVRNLNLFAEADRDYWDNQVDSFLEKTSLAESEGYFCLGLEKTALRKKARALRLRIYGGAIARLLAAARISGQARGETLLCLDEALASGVSGKIFQLPGAVEIELAKKQLIFRIRASGADKTAS